MFFWAAGNLSSQTTWTGDVSANWHTAGNWSAGVPGTNDDAIIPNVTNDPVISAAGAVAKSVVVQSDGLLTINTSGTLAINGSTAKGFLNQGTVQNNGIINIGNVSAVGDHSLANEAAFNNNPGAQLNIDRVALSKAAIDNTSGTFTNQGSIHVGDLSEGGYGIYNTAVFMNNGSAQINVERSVRGISNYGTFTNQAVIHLGSAANDGAYGIENAGFSSVFNNNTGGVITIDFYYSGIYVFSNELNNSGTVTINQLGGVAAILHEQGLGDFNNNTGGVFKCSGSINASVFNNNGGTLAPGYSPGRMTFLASENFSNSNMEIEIDGAGMAGVNYDQVLVLGAATLGGTLELSINYTPVNGHEMTIISAGSITGTFSTVTGLPSNWTISYLPDRVVIAYGANYWNGNTSTNWNTAGNWSLGTVPGINDNVIIPNTTNDPVINIAGAVAKSVWVQSGGLLTVANTGTLTINGSSTQGIRNEGTVQNNGTINIGNTSTTGTFGIVNESDFHNNASGQINIDRCAIAGIFANSGSFNNAGTILVGALVNQINLLHNLGATGSFINNAGGLFKGNGNIGAAQFAHAGGTLSPGYSPGKVVYSSNEDFSNSTLFIEADAIGTPGVNYDQVVVNGAATLGGTLSLAVNFPGNYGDGVVILSATNVTGTFSTVTGLPANWYITYLTTEVILSYGVAAQSTWTGAVNSDWNNAGNWSAGVPGAGTNVIIPDVTNDPVISTAGAIARNITILSGALLTVNASGSLSINGSFTDGFVNQGTVQNHGLINIGNTSAVGTRCLVNESLFYNNPGAQINIDRVGSGMRAVDNVGGTFTNQGSIHVGGVTEGGYGIYNAAVFLNDGNAQINVERSVRGIANYGSFTNQAVIHLGSAANDGAYGIENAGLTTVFNNNAGGLITVDYYHSGMYLFSGNFNNNGTVEINLTGGVTKIFYDQGFGMFNNHTGGFFKCKGQVYSPVFNSNGGTLAPGNPMGIMMFSASENLSNNIVEIGLNGTGIAGVNYDRIVVTGTATLGGTLALSVGFSPDDSHEITIVSATTISGIFSTVTGLPADWTIIYSSNTVKLLYCTTQSPPISPTTADNGLHFDGVDDYININNNYCPTMPFLNGGNAITIEYWFKGSSNQSAVRLQAQSDVYIVAGWNGKHILSNDQGAANGINIGAGYNDGNWHHIAMTWQRNTTNGFKSYLDGQLVAQRNSADSPLPVFTFGLCLGAYNGQSEFMHGALNEVRIWTVVRSQAEIQANQNSLTLPQTGLLGYYKFDHGAAGGNNAGINVVANSANANDFKGLLRNFALNGATSNWVAALQQPVTWYRDLDGDGFGNPGITQQAVDQPMGYVDNDDDCNDNNALEKPGQVWYKDSDNDGYAQTSATTITQCLRPAGHKAVVELISTTGDCNDNNNAINPAAAEICDGIDNNCNGSTDEGVLATWYRDQDGDGFGNPAVTQTACSQPSGYVSNNTDCADNDPLEKPGQVWYKDSDNDGYAQTGATTITQCLRPAGYKTAIELASTTGDCNDNNNAINPAAAEICDGIDNNCNGSTDEGVLTTYYRDQDGDGFGNPAVTQTACSHPSGYVANNTDCDDNDPLEKPGQVWYKDNDNDGYAETGAATITQCLRPAGHKAAVELASTTGDCNDNNNAINPAAAEICDGIDNNCNGSTDEGVLATWYRDQDGDGFGNPAVTQTACSQPSGYVLNNTDCDDNDALEKPGQVWYKDSDNDGYAQTGAATITQCLRPAGHKAAVELASTTGDCNDNNNAINPAAAEICDGIDNNCNGSTDEGVLATYYRDQDGDGFGNPSNTTQACSLPSGYVTNNTDCDDNDALEKPGQVWYADLDDDGYGTGETLTQCLRPSTYKLANELIATTGDCNDDAPGVNPGAVDVCDDIDNDCNGQIDEPGSIDSSWEVGNIGTGANGTSNQGCSMDNQTSFDLNAQGFSMPAADAGHSVYQEFCGNTSITVRVVAVSGGGWAGIQMRESLEGGSRMVGLKTRLTTTGIRESRANTNAPKQMQNYQSTFMHRWLRITRNGNTFQSFISVDGVAWQLVGTVNIAMSSCLYVGMVVESINVNTTTLASFTNVSIGGGVAPLAGSPDVNPAETHTRVYPNPTTGEVNLGLEDYQGRAVRIEVYSMLGQLLNFVEIDEVQTTVTELDLSAYQNGSYLIRVHTDGQPDTSKWVKLLRP